MKKFALIALISSVLIGCGGGGGDDGEHYVPDVEQPENVLPPPEFIPDPELPEPEEPEEVFPPAVEGGDVPDIGVDYEQPAEDGGVLPDMSMGSWPVMVSGQIVAVKETVNNTFFFGVIEHSIGSVILPNSRISYTEDDIVWIYSETYEGITHVDPFGMTPEQIRLMPEYTPTFSTENVVTLAEPMCFSMLEGGEFCSTLYSDRDIDLHPHVQGVISDYTENTVEINRLVFPIDKVINDHLVELKQSHVMLFKKPNGKFTMVATPNSGTSHSTMVVNVVNVDKATRTLNYVDSKGELVEMVGTPTNHFGGIEEGDLVYVRGFMTYEDKFHVAHMAKVDLPPLFE